MLPRRLVRAAATLLLALPLAACSVKGEAWVEADRVRLDVTVAYATDDPMGGPGVCSMDLAQQIPGLTVTFIETPAGQTSCRLVGDVAQDEASWPFGRVTVVTPEHLFLRLPHGYVSDPATFTGVDLTVHFPGEVLAASGGAHVQGSTVTWIDPDRVRAEGFSVTARARPDLPGWLVPGLAGLAWGAALTLAARWLLPRSDADAQDPDTPATTADHDLEPILPPVASDQPAEDPRVWADDA